MARGFGWVRSKKVKDRRTGNAKMHYYASYLNPDDKKERINAPHFFDTKSDARRWLDDEHKLISSGVWTRPADRIKEEKERNLLFSEYAERWFSLNEGTWKPRTRQTYRQRLDTKLLPVFGNTRLADITPTMVNTWYASMAGAPSERANSYGILKQILGEACKPPSPLIAYNPCQIKGGSLHRGMERPIASPEQLQAIADAMPGKFRLAVLLAGWLSLRSGEVRALRRRDIDLAKQELHVTHNVTYTKETRFVDSTPKTRAGVRTVAIPDFLVPVIQEHLSKYVGKGKDALLFPNTSGGYLYSFEKPYLRARKAMGMPDLRFHDLRHTGNTMAMQTGATLADLQKRGGWTSSAMVMHYAHSTVDRQHQIAAGLDAIERGKAGKDESESVEELKASVAALREENERLMKLLIDSGGAEKATQ